MCDNLLFNNPQLIQKINNNELLVIHAWCLDRGYFLKIQMAFHETCYRHISWMRKPTNVSNIKDLGDIKWYYSIFHSIKTININNQSWLGKKRIYCDRSGNSFHSHGTTNVRTHCHMNTICKVMIQNHVKWRSSEASSCSGKMVKRHRQFQHASVDLNGKMSNIFEKGAKINCRYSPWDGYAHRVLDMPTVHPPAPPPPRNVTDLGWPSCLVYKCHQDIH